MVQSLKGCDTLIDLCTVGCEAIAVDTAGKVPLEQVLLRNLPA